VTDVVLTHLHVDHVAGCCRRAEGPVVRRADHLAAAEVEFWASPDFSRNTFGGFPDVLRSAEQRFVDVYRSQLRPFEKEDEVAPGWSSVAPVPHLRHSVVRWRPAATADVPRRCRVFPNHLTPDGTNALRHDAEEAGLE